MIRNFAPVNPLITRIPSSEARAAQDKDDQAKLERLITERGEPPVLYRKAKGKLSDFMMDSPEDIHSPDQLENIANEIFDIDLSETYEEDMAKSYV